MNESGEVRMEARLLSNKLGGDIADVQRKIEQNLGTTGKGGSVSQAAKNIGRAPTPTASSLAMLKALNPAFRAAALAQHPELAAIWGEGGKGGKITNASAAFSGGGFKGYKIGDEYTGSTLAKIHALGTMGGHAAQEKGKSDMDRAKFIKDATFAMMPLFNPTSVWGNLFASRQIFSGLTQTKFGQGLVGKLGMGTGTGASALAAGGTVGVLLAVGLAIKALTKAIHESIKAYQDAPKLYAKALTSGLGLQFVSKRSILADIMGVSEQEVIKYAYAFNYLNPKIEWASNIMAKTTTTLTAVGWEWKVVFKDFTALMADIAVKNAPILLKLANGFENLFKRIDDAINKHPALAKMMLSPLYALDWVGSKLAGKPAGTKGWEAKAPPPISFMKQLPASSWERMGLVLGGGMGANPAKETAHNTKTMAQDIKKLVSYVARSGGAPTFNLQNAP